MGAGPVWLRHCEHTPVLSAASLLPHSVTEKVSLEKIKVSIPALFVSGWKSDTEETSKQKKL